MKEILPKFKLNESYDKIIVVDPGKNAVKVLVFDTQYNLLDKYSFPSKTKQKRNFADIDGSSKRQYKVEFDGIKYLVGEGIQGLYDFQTTKNNLHHKLCIYTAIANSVVKKDERIYLLAGYPSSDFTNTNQLNDYKELINSKERIEFEINGECKSFYIAGFGVYPEGIGFKPRVEHQGKSVNIIDIGGQNVNFRAYDKKGNTLISFSSDSTGINHLEESFRKKLRTFVKADVISVESIDFLGAVLKRTISEIDYLNNNILYSYENSKELLEDIVLTFIEEKVLGELVSKGINLYQRGNFIIFTGGGALLLKPYIEEILVNNKGNMSFSNTAKWDNCISYVIKDLGDRCKKVGAIKEAQLMGSYILKQFEKDKDMPLIN